MRKIHQPTVPPAGLFASGEKKKLIAMSVGLLLLVVAFFASRYKESEYREREKGMLSAPPTTERVAVPELDGASLEPLVSDGSDADRVLLEREAVDAALEMTRNLGPAHFDALETPVLTAGRADELLADPSASRGEPFTVRGWIHTMKKRRPGGGRPDELHGRIVMEEDETSVYFVTTYVGDGILETDYVRLDGVFVKAFNAEDPENPGQWIQGPLIVGPEIVRSYESLGVVTELPERVFLDVADDDVVGGITGLPHRPLYALIAYVRDGADDAIDWASAPELDKAAVTKMLMDGSSWRAQPFRLPPSQVMDAWVSRPGENAARQEVITEGWIGNWNWTGEAKVLRFAMPGAHDLDPGDLIQGRGFFLKNYAYEPRDGGMRLASMVVLDSLDPFVAREDSSIDQLWTGVIVMVVGLGLLLFLMVMRDRKRSQRIQETLMRRRRERRAGRAAPPGDESPGLAPPAS